MRRPKAKQGQIIEIEWVDSLHDSGWKNWDQVKDGEEWLDHKTIGYFVRNTKRTVMVAQSISKMKDKPNVDAVMQIPFVSINKWRRVR